jgi:hypothetical protein
LVVVVVTHLFVVVLADWNAMVLVLVLDRNPVTVGDNLGPVVVVLVTVVAVGNNVLNVGSSF